MKKLVQLIPLIFRLGVVNFICVVLYQTLKKLRVLEMLTPVREYKNFELFKVESGDIAEKKGTVLSNIEVKQFSFFSTVIQEKPNWFKNYYSNKEFEDPNRHWSFLSDFDSKIGDIKTVWELSRFGWAVEFARIANSEKNHQYIELINRWGSDWMRRNPINQGPNWKCGQETSLRMMQLLLTAKILGQAEEPSQALVEFVTSHAERIIPTIRYAISQDNNHAISEAAGLYVAGIWLLSLPKKYQVNKSAACRWKKRGKYWLEKLVRKLIEDDGTFSQYSVAYHRMALDILVNVKYWSRVLKHDKFSPAYYEKIRKMLDWLFQMVDPDTGLAPNLGANDGSCLFHLTECDYRDFRPSLVNASALFLGEKLYEDKEYCDGFDHLGIERFCLKETTLARKTSVFDKGGFTTFDISKQCWGVIRHPNFRFRPNQADALHLDLWYKGKNILQDAGTYSYNCPAKFLDYFSGTRAHNTVEFDGKDQMPRVSRFLFSDWLKVKVTKFEISESGAVWEGYYQNRNYHKRRIEFSKKKCIVTDYIDGFEKVAKLRWRLCNDDWTIQGSKCFSSDLNIDISCENRSYDLSLESGWNSNYYMEKHVDPVLTISLFDSPQKIVSTIKFLNN